jgi:hypothetical protein
MAGSVREVTRTMVRVLEDERSGFSFRWKCVPNGSLALIEPRRDERRRWGEDAIGRSMGDD